jgi:hypothetical protein
VQTHGSWGILWTGYTSALIQSIPHNMVMFSVYNYAKGCLDHWGFMNTSESDLASRMGCSVLGSYAAIVVTSPIDITRTHKQALISAEATSCPAGRSASINVAKKGTAVMSVPGVPSSWVVLKGIVDTHGARHLFRGSYARLLSSTPYTVAMLIGYDYVKLYSLRTPPT